MKTTPHLFFAVLVTATSHHLLAENPANTTTARILGGVPDGTPPPPEAPKPGFIVKPANLLSSRTQQQGGRTITLGEIKPIALPAPLKSTSPSPTDPAVQERFKAMRQTHQETSLLLVGATTSRSPDGSVRSLVTLQPLGIGEPVTFVSSADFALLAGIRSFIDTAGKTHDLLMSWSVEPNELPSALAARLQRNNDLKKLPKLPPGPATLTAIQSLHAPSISPSNPASSPPTKVANTPALAKKPSSNPIHPSPKTSSSTTGTSEKAPQPQQKEAPSEFSSPP